MRAGEVKCRWRKSLKQRLEEQAKLAQPANPARKVASVITVKTTPPVPQPEVLSPVEEPLIKIESSHFESNQPDLTLFRRIEITGNRHDSESESEPDVPIQSLKIEEPEDEPVAVNDNNTVPIVEQVEEAESHDSEEEEEKSEDSPLVIQLLSMGFDRENVLKAVAAGDSDLESAVNYLLGDL